MRFISVLLLAALVLALPAGCGKKVLAPQPAPQAPAPAQRSAPKGTFKPYTIAGKTYRPLLAADASYVEEGTASWYGPDFHGKPTACGEKYDMHAMTAAHKLLPMHTRLRVTNLDNGKEAGVRVNDRGPFVGERVIDLSYAAATSLGIVGPGTGRVRLEVVSGAGMAREDVARALERGSYYIQVGAFTDEGNADRLLASLRSGGYTGSRKVRALVGGVWYWRVQAGVLLGLQNALQALEGFGPEHPGAFIIAAD
jgi:rare lipoprotein A